MRGCLTRGFYRTFPDRCSCKGRLSVIIFGRIAPRYASSLTVEATRNGNIPVTRSIPAILWRSRMRTVLLRFIRETSHTCASKHEINVVCIRGTPDNLGFGFSFFSLLGIFARLRKIEITRRCGRRERIGSPPFSCWDYICPYLLYPWFLADAESS